MAGGGGWDVFVPNNYTIPTYVNHGIIDPLDMAKVPACDAANFKQRFAGPGTVDVKLYTLSKDWGTTGFAVNTKQLADATPLSTWKEFWDMSKGRFSGRPMVHHDPLTTIGNAMK